MALTILNFGAWVWTAHLFICILRLVQRKHQYHDSDIFVDDPSFSVRNKVISTYKSK